MVKRDKHNWKLCYFDVLVRFSISKTVRNDKLPIEFRECGIADKISKVVIFENTYLWVIFGKFHFLYIYAQIFIPYF